MNLETRLKVALTTRSRNQPQEIGMKEFKRPPYNYFGIPPSSLRDFQGAMINGEIYEYEDVVHGISCKCCSSVKDSERLAEQYKRKIQALHRGRNAKRRAGRARDQIGGDRK
jgi:hypothetical protein